MMRRRSLLALVLLSCGPNEAPARARIWPLAAIFAAEPGKTLGGFVPTQLVAKAGAPVAFRPQSFAQDDSVVVQPAYWNDAPAAYVVTEIWEDHPDPWVQPVYHFVSEQDSVSPLRHRLRHSDGTPVEGLFGVGVDSTFYTPFWRLFTLLPGDAKPPFTQVAQVAHFPRQGGPLVTCPIVPGGVRLSSRTHPLTGEALRPVGEDLPAYVNGERVAYLGLGTNLQETLVDERGVDQTVAAVPLYVFVTERDGSTVELKIPAVLPTDAAHHAYVRRVEVTLAVSDATNDHREAIFLPQAFSALAADIPAGLLRAGDPAISEADARAHLLQVATDSSCFADSVKFKTCSWLGSASAIEQLVSLSRRRETKTTLTATVVSQLP